VYGDVSPEVVAVQVKALPEVSPLGGHDTVLLSAEPPILTVAEPLCVIVFVSRALTLMVLLPFVEQVTEIVLVVDEPVQPVGIVQVNVYGDVPPVTVAVQVKATFMVWPLPQLTLTANGCPATTTDVEPVCVIALPSLAVLLIE